MAQIPSHKHLFLPTIVKIAVENKNRKMKQNVSTGTPLGKLETLCYYCLELFPRSRRLSTRDKKNYI